MATYLVRYVEIGRDAQPARQKQRRDLAGAIVERVPGARVTELPGRLVVDDAPADVEAVLAALPGILSVSPCRQVPTAQLHEAIVDLARGLSSTQAFAVRVRRGGMASGMRSLELAKSLGDAVALATGARVDLANPDVALGVEVRGDEAFVFDRVVDGVDRTGPAAPRHGEPRFVVDQMLGRLGARLRLLGYDAAGVFDIADSEVARIAASEGRVLLTRDNALARTNAVTAYFVQATTARDQLAEVIDALGLVPDPARMFSRCTVCNVVVEPVEENDRVPPNVRGRGLTFTRCPSCDRLYWRGSHVERILDDLAPR